MWEYEYNKEINRSNTKKKTNYSAKRYILKYNLFLYIVELKVIRDSDSDDSSSNSDDDDENIHENPRKTIGSIRMRSETLKSQIIKDIGEALFNNCYKYLKDETNRNEGNITLLDIPYIRTNILSLFKTTDVDYALKYAKQVCDLIFMESFG